MIKKILVVLTLIVILPVVYYFITRSRKQENFISPLSENKSNKTTPSTVFKEYLDPSGFQFNYPNSLTVAVQQPIPDDVYSDLRLTSPKVSGNLTIKASDSGEATFNKLIGNKKTSSIKLADLDGHQYQEKNSLITLAYDQGVLFEIVADLSENKNFWTKVNNDLVASFKFVQPSTDNKPASPAGGPADSTGGEQTTDNDVIFEGEEVVE